MRKLFVWLGISTAVLIAGAVFANWRMEAWARGKAVEELRSRYGRDLQFKSLSISVLPRVAVDGEDLVFREADRGDAATVISIRRLAVRGGILQLLRSPRHLSLVRFEELTITVPPRRDRNDKPEPPPARTGRAQTPIVVDRIVCEAATVKILPKERWKDPLEYRIHHLTMTDVGLDRPAPFTATLTNARPPGEIAVKGRFGPWHQDEPGQTPVAASYAFEKADLADFNGIAGILSSTGRFSGVLERLVVDGETRTPDFRLTKAGNPVPLETEFHAIVDGTNGDTVLDPVRATLGRSRVDARGGVVQLRGRKGKTVRLDVTVPHGRIEDMLRLAVPSERAPMTGAIRFKTDFELPPGQGEVADRLRLNGRFGIDAAQFASGEIQGKVNEMSGKARGEPEEADRVVSDLKGAFRLAEGFVRFNGLTFAVPGAVVLLDGSYGLESEQLDFRGKLRMDAKLSETTTGVKSFFLKLADPFFRKKDRTEVPIKVTGTRRDPDFGLALGK